MLRYVRMDNDIFTETIERLFLWKKIMQINIINKMNERNKDYYCFFYW